jgi:hypothetical protein
LRHTVFGVQTHGVWGAVHEAASGSEKLVDE